MAAQGTPQGEGGTGVAILLLIGYIFQNILHPAVQNLAQRVQRGGGDGFPVLHAVDGVGIHPLLEDEIVLRDFLFQQCPIKRIVANQIFHPCLGYHSECIGYTE